MWTVLFVATTIIFATRWWAEKVRCKAIIYYLVEKEYTAPTKQDVERCVEIVIEKTVNGWFKK